MGFVRRLGSALSENLAIQDGVCLFFHGSMLMRLYLAEESPHKAKALPGLWALFFVTLGVVLLTRGELLPKGPLRSLLYRVGIIAPLPLSYFTLRHVLPAISPHLLDAQFLALDTALFGLTPALYLERFVTKASTEWFSFFYYSYFAMTALFVLGTAFFDQGRRRAELLTGAMMVVCIGHTLYGFFPGVGPYAAMRFTSDLSGGLFLSLVQQAVTSAGAMYDIFPSLHTADPTLFALHALRHRKEGIYRYLWPVAVFFSANMVISTMFLRWHYGIDVLAGLLLALIAQQVGIAVARLEEDRLRAERGKQLVWESFST